MKVPLAMRSILCLALLSVFSVPAFALNGVNEIPSFSEKRRALTSEFAVIQKDLKAAKTTDQTNAVARRLDDFCLRVNALRGDEDPPSPAHPFGVLAECDKYRRCYGTTERALSARVDSIFAELKGAPLPTAGNYDPQAINKIQRVLDKMGELLQAAERVRACTR